MRSDKRRTQNREASQLIFLWTILTSLFLQTSFLCAPGCLMIFKFIISRASSQSKVTKIIVTQGHGTHFGKQSSKTLSMESRASCYPQSPEWYLAYKVFVGLGMYLWVHPADLCAHTQTRQCSGLQLQSCSNMILCLYPSACGSPSSAL